MPLALPGSALPRAGRRVSRSSFATRSRGLLRHALPRSPAPRRAGSEAMAAVAEERVCFQARK
eukprot:13154894-Alexandrium_andersonii.AAC.1